MASSPLPKGDLVRKGVMINQDYIMGVAIAIDPFQLVSHVITFFYHSGSGLFSWFPET